MNHLNHSFVGHFILSAVILLMGTAIAVTADDPPLPDVHEIVVNVSLQRPDGTPLEQGPIALLSKAQGRFAFTNANGIANFTIAKVDDEQHIMAFMSSGMWFTPPEDRPTAIDRYHELRDTYAFKRQYYVPTVGLPPYSFTIQAGEAVTLTGRLVDPDDTPMEGYIGSESTVSHDILWPNDNGEFSLGGFA